MPKGPNFSQRMHRAFEIANLQTANFTEQLMGDFFTIYMQRNGVSRSTILAICEAVAKDVDEFRAEWNSEYHGDKDVGITADRDCPVVIDHLDKALRYACGDVIPFVPFEERYAGLCDQADKMLKEREKT